MNTPANFSTQSWFWAVIIAVTLSACASNPGASGKADNVVDTGANSKAAQKISTAIGVDSSAFSITNQQKIEAPMGLEGLQYTVKTNAGKTYKCEIMEPSGFGKAMTFGTGTGSYAMCTNFTPGSKEQGKTNSASCNALLKAANKC